MKEAQYNDIEMDHLVKTNEKYEHVYFDTELTIRFGAFDILM